jgi:predicted GNAT family N-acyltransferase
MKLKINALLIALYTITTQCCEANKTTTIRLGAIDDLDAIIKMSQDLYQNNFRPVWQKHLSSSDNTNDFINKRINTATLEYKNLITQQTKEPNNQRLLVAELTQSHNKIIVGICRFEKKETQKVYVKMLAVDKEFRNQGIAKQLIRTTMSTFVDITKYEFRTLKDDEFINNLYTRHGCVKEGSSTLDPNTGEITTDPTLPMIYFNYSYTVKK